MKPNNSKEWVNKMADIEEIWNDEANEEADVICKIDNKKKTKTIDEDIVIKLSEKIHYLEENIFFNHLVKWWKEETKFVSSTTEMVEHPAYKGIIWMGNKAIPFILEQLVKEPDHYFYALKKITGKDPVPEEFRGNIEEMARIWIKEIRASLM